MGQDLALAAVLKNLEQSLPEPGYGMPESEYRAAIQRDQEERARQAAEGVAAGEELARRLGQTPITSGVKPEKALRYQEEQKRRRRSMKKAAPSKKASPVGSETKPSAPITGIVAMVDPETGRRVFTNVPGSKEYEGMKELDRQAAAQQLWAKETPQQASGPFALRAFRETGEYIPGSVSQNPMPSSDKYLGLDEETYRKTVRANESPLVQDIMDKERADMLENQLGILQKQRLENAVIPEKAAAMEMATRNAIIKEAQNDPGIELRVIQKMNALKQKFPNMGPRDLAQLEAALRSAEVMDYVRKNDPELQMAQAKSGMLGL